MEQQFTNEELINQIRSGKGNVGVLKNTLVEQNKGLCYKELMEIQKKHPGLSFHNMQELEQEAYLGLALAIELFDTEKGANFATYATHKIKGRMKNALSDMLYGDIPKRMKKMCNMYLAFLNDYQMRNGSTPTPKTAMELLGWNLGLYEEVQRCLNISRMESLDVLTQTGEETFLNEASLLSDEDVYSRVEAAQCRELIEKNMQELHNERQEYILHEYYYKGRTYEDISKELGVSKVRVHQLERKGIKTLGKKDDIQKWHDA